MEIELDPGTICARTHAGEVELQEARRGLTLPQRKTLSLLAAPQVFAELAAENRLEPVRLGRDLVRLAEIGLIVLLVPSARGERDDRLAEAANSRSSTPAASRWGMRPAMLPIAIAAALAVAIAIAWLGLRGAPSRDLSPSVDPRAASSAPITAAARDGADGDDAAAAPPSDFPPPARLRNRASSRGRALSRN